MLPLFPFGIFWIVWKWVFFLRVLQTILGLESGNFVISKTLGLTLMSVNNNISANERRWLPIVKDQHLKEACYCKSLLYIFGWPFLLNKVVISLQLKG